MRRITLMHVLFLLLAWQPAGAAQPVPPIGPNDLVLGSDKAPVTVIEYASMTCPHCGRWATEVFPRVKSDLIDTGKIRYAFRDYPLDGIALKASELARCEPSRFYGFVQVLFEQQENWVPRQQDQDPMPDLIRLARLGGLSESKVKACLDDKTIENSILASRQGAEAADVNSTPTFFFNGTSHAGEISYDEFAKMVKDASK